MPNPTSHMYLVHDLSFDKSEQYKSYLLLGSISPDIRVITKTPRIEYHYFYYIFFLYLSELLELQNFFYFFQLIYKF